ncbi:MAG TPA: hypothetical protein DEO99_07980 [Bacteroidetes bacterium]|nr:hypothetical protein [Bacteroidota bacterium]
MSRVLSIIILAFSIFLVGNTALYAQRDLDANLTKALSDEEIGGNADQFVLRLGFNRLCHNENAFTPYWSSLEVGYDFFVDMPFGPEDSPSKFSLAIGGGLQWNNYFHNGRFVHDSTGLAFQETADFRNQDSVRRSKLGVIYYNIPIELRFRSQPKRKGLAFKWALGWQTGFKLRSYQKEVRNETGNYQVFRTNRYRDVNFLRTGPTARIGIGALNIQGFYSLTGLFKKDKGPSMTPWSVSLFISAF